MEIMEKDLEQIIYETDKEILSKKGLNITGKLYRQIRIGGYGIADLIEVKRQDYNFIQKYQFEPNFIITVYELKKDNISVSAVMQAIRYVKGIKRYLENRKVTFTYDIIIDIIGKDIKIEDSALVYIPDVIPITTCGSDFIRFTLYKYDINGLRFEEVPIINLKDEGFNNERSR